MDTNARLRQLPKVDVLLERPELAALAEDVGRTVVLEAVREALDAARAAILATPDCPESASPDVAAGPTADEIAVDAAARVRTRARTSLRRVINATGIIVHTNIGRSPLAYVAADAAADIARGYSTLEFDVESGARGSRHAHVEGLICKLTGAEAAMAVNNNAAAVLLAIAALARGKEAIVSRGELVEIGGSFRVPDVMRESGATMVEVGTTNKTHLRDYENVPLKDDIAAYLDYENAITENTGLLLKVHTSNYRVVGFTEGVPAAELVALGARNSVPVMEDQGSGVLLDLARWNLPHEPTVGEAVAAGLDVVTFSGDKLLGGPQAGILAGRYHVIAALKKHPLARAVRLDKMTLAALEATLRLYLDPERAAREVPTLRMLSAPRSEIAERAERLVGLIEAAAPGRFSPVAAEDVSRAGGGALPMADIPTSVVSLVPTGCSVDDLERALRLGEPHIIARISEGRLLLDPRTILPDEDDEVVSALARIASEWR